MATENWDDLNDDDFMAALDDASYAPEEEDIEDTNQETETEFEEPEETETDELIDDETQESEEPGFEDDDEETEGNTQAENDSEPSEENDEPEDEKAENDADETEEGDEGKKADEEINYQEEYAKVLEEKARYEDFYNQATGEFIANGRKTKGFDDPKKILQSQQMAAGYSEKMAAFKKYKPFMNTLKDKGMLDTPEKFNLAMNLLDGDPEALKQHIKNLEIDPFELDMDNIDYVPKNEIASEIEVALDDLMETAQQNGVEDSVQKIISKDWDDESIIELLEDPTNSSELIEHLNTGAYDIVQDRMAEKKRSDVNQIYTSKPVIEQYREAAQELEREYLEYLRTQEPVEEQATENTGSEWIQPNPEEVQQNEEYKAQVAKQNAKTNEARRKATSLSKKKRGTRKQKPQPDPLTLDDDKFTEYLDSLVYQ